MLVINRNIWLARVYRYWERLTGGNSWDYQENLCHFVRVIVFWTWWHAFWKQRLPGNTRPWMWAVVPTLLIELWLYPQFTFRWLMYIGLTAAVIIVALLAIYILSGKFGTAITQFLVQGFELIINIVVWIFYWPARAIYLLARWFLGLRLSWIPVWTILLLAAYISMAWWNFGVFLEILAVAIVIGLVFGAIVGVMFVSSIDSVRAAWWATRETVGNATEAVTRPVLNTGGVVISWLMAQKRKICPLIEFTPEPTPDQAPTKKKRKAKR